MTQDYQWNRPELLPPVGCPLVIRIGDLPGPFLALKVERVNWLRDKNGDMDYRSTATGHIYKGRYPWSYP